MLLPSLLPLAALMVSPATEVPRRAPAQFVTTDYSITFRTPAGSTYCPMPANFDGIYHGPTLFLTSATRCGSRTGPQLYVGYWVRISEDVVPRDPCDRDGSVRMFGTSHPLCRGHEAGMIIFQTSARYSQEGKADGAYELIMRLETTPERMDADVATLRATAASVTVCSSKYFGYDDQGRRKRYVNGSGAPCPQSARFIF